MRWRHRLQACVIFPRGLDVRAARSVLRVRKLWRWRYILPAPIVLRRLCCNSNDGNATLRLASRAREMPRSDLTTLSES
jgi:hypothetical protein